MKGVNGIVRLSKTTRINRLSFSFWIHTLKINLIRFRRRWGAVIFSFFLKINPPIKQKFNIYCFLMTLGNLM